MSPIRSLAERDEPLISFGPKPKKKKVKAEPIAWWKFWKSAPVKKAKAKKEANAEKIVWPSVVAFLVGGVAVWFFLRDRKKNEALKPSPKSQMESDHVGVY